MMTAIDLALEPLHATASEIFTGALAECSIESAFDRRLRFEGNVLHRLLPDGSGPEKIDLAAYKRVFVIAMGKAALPMLDVLLDRMKRRQGLRGICCSNQQPRRKNWRFRYFEGGHPLPNEDSFSAARAALAMLKKARKDTLVFFLISGGGSAIFDLPLDPTISLEATRDFHQALIASGSSHQRSEYAAQALLLGKGRPTGNRGAGSVQGLDPAAGCAAAFAGCAVVGANIAGSFNG